MEKADAQRKSDAEINERAERLKRTELKIRQLIEFIANGNRSDYVISTMRDLEAYARTEKAELDALVERSRQPISLPSLVELEAMATNLKACVMCDVDGGREMLRRYLEDGVVTCSVDEEGAFASCNLGARILLEEIEARNRRIPGVGSDSRDSQVFASSSGGSQSGLYDAFALDFEADLAACVSTRSARARFR